MRFKPMSGEETFSWDAFPAIVCLMEQGGGDVLLRGCVSVDSWLSVESFSRFWLKCFDWLRNKTFFQSSKCFSKNILVSLNFLEIYGQEEMKKEVEFIHGFCSPAPSWESRNTAKLLRRNKIPPASAMCKGRSLTSTTAAPSPSWGSWL